MSIDSEKFLSDLIANCQANKFGVGTLAYLDTFAGLIKCRVIAIHKTCYGSLIGKNDEIDIRLLETVGAYRKGETLTRSAFACPPCVMIKRYRFTRTIRHNYTYNQ